MTKEPRKAQFCTCTWLQEEHFVQRWQKNQEKHSFVHVPDCKENTLYRDYRRTIKSTVFTCTWLQEEPFAQKIQLEYSLYNVHCTRTWPLGENFVLRITNEPAEV